MSVKKSIPAASKMVLITLFFLNGSIVLTNNPILINQTAMTEGVTNETNLGPRIPKTLSRALAEYLPLQVIYQYQVALITPSRLAQYAEQ